MKKPSIALVVSLVIIAAVIMLVASYSRPQTRQASVAGQDGIVCHDSPKYFVISRSRAPDAGTDFLVKYKNSADQSIPCSYSPAQGDFEIRNDSADYFLALNGNDLILDSGTGPARTTMVYNLVSRKRVLSDK